MTSLIRFPPEWGIEPVPKEKRNLRTIDISVLWFSLGVGLLVMQAGALLIRWLNLGIIEAFYVTLLGSLVGSLILAGAGIIGSKYGVPTMVSLRPLLGIKGTYLPTILNVIQLIGWTTFEIIIMGDAATALTGEFLGPYTKYFWMTVFALWCFLLAVYGPLAVIRQWLEKIAIWLVYISSAWITYNVFQTSIPINSFKINIASLLLGLDLVIAMPVSWMPLISDYNRFAQHPRKGFLGTFISYTVANMWFYMMGAALALIYPSENIVYSIALLMLGNIAILGILVDETDNAFADIYSSAISLQNIFPKIRQWKLVTIITIISLSLAYIVPIFQYENFLLLIGASFIPLFGVMFAEYFIVRRGVYSIDEFYHNAPNIKIEPLISWSIGFTIYYLMAYVFIHLNIGATLPSFLSSLISYIIIKKVFKR